MRIIKIISLALCLCIAAFKLSAQEEVIVKELRASRNFALQMPIMLDSVDLKDKKFDTKKLLETHLSIPEYEAFNRPYIATDTSNYIYLSKPQAEYSLQLLSFQLSSDRYSKPKLEFSSPSILRYILMAKRSCLKLPLRIVLA